MGRTLTSNGPSAWLPNSNKIGLGYNPLFGSPVCYVGNCQMDGFTQPLFKLNFTKQQQGSCTDKLIPQHVSIDCLPSMDNIMGSEIISNVSHLFDSMLSGIEISASAKIKMISFSYTYSTQTSKMIDKIYKDKTVAIRTSVKVSSVRLTMFEPKMPLSDEFIYVIEQMPCCDGNAAEVMRYIEDYVFYYFGFTYVQDVLLGGIAQQILYIKQKDLSMLKRNGSNYTNKPELEPIAWNIFSLSFHLKINNKDKNDGKNESLINYAETSQATKFGGDATLTSIEDWSKTVPSNPVAIKFGVQQISQLLTKKRFPNDPNITKKAALIEQALDRYLHKPIFCYNNCSNNGVCQPSGYFRFGICQCSPGWSGFDCSTAVPLVLSLSGTICGSRTVKCDGIDLSQRSTCPDGWDYYTDSPFGSFCYKRDSNALASRPTGILCGLVFEGRLIDCDGRNFEQTSCPTGYERPSGSNNCFKVNNDITDLPGTLCGMYVNVPQCYQLDLPCGDGDDYPGRGACPPGYQLFSAQEKDRPSSFAAQCKSQSIPSSLFHRYQPSSFSTCIKR